MSDSNETVEKIAKTFGDMLKHELTPEERAQVVARNLMQKSALICHSHDFIDANETMADAFKDAGVKDATDYDEDDIKGKTHATDIWNQAWDLAKANHFYFKLEDFE